MNGLKDALKRIGLLAGFGLTSIGAPAQTPQWIWQSITNAPAGGDAVVYFRKTFNTPPLLWNARLTVAADDEAEVFLNGVSVALCSRPDRPVRAEVSVRLHQGANVVAARARHRSGPGGLLVQLNLGGQTNIVSDTSWLATTNIEAGWSTLAFNAADWPAARSLGPLGVAPWGDVLTRPVATPVERLSVPAGFRVELLRSAGPDEGSWICLAFDERGRLFVSPAGDKYPLLRLTLAGGQVSRVEPVPAPVHYAMGLLFAHGSLYASALGPQGAGLYRLMDTNHNDQFDPEEMRLLKKFEGGSEHGYHALALGPEGKIYALNGNGTRLPQGLSSASPYRNYREDMLSQNPDETRKPDGALAPDGYIVRTDVEGRDWELFLGGLRNTYSFDFNADGELFGFDSDMEWDWGTPWYRPTRIFHGVSGGEYGWRDGIRTWPDYYEDSLPGAVDIGIGSPTGVKFGGRSRFPENYRRALFAMDWSYGRIFAVHLEPDGASYRGKAETFLRGTPLNLTDLAFGPDGALYFITGGRGTQSGLYRVSYTGGATSTAPLAKTSSSDPAARARALRHQLERFHGRADDAAVDFLWPHLASSDRFIRSAARLALQSQPAVSWRERALAETHAGTALSALLALARVSGTEVQRDLLKALARFPLDALSESDQLRKLRVIELSFLRQGRPQGDLAALAISQLDRHFPATSWPLNRELSRLLLWLEAPGAVNKTLDLLGTAPTQEQQLHYIAQLRNVPQGWTPAARRRFLEWWLKPRDALAHPPEVFGWFADAGRGYVDGAWVDRYLREFHRDAVAALSAQERTELAGLLNRPLQKARQIPSTIRAHVRQWTMADLLPHLDEAGAGRDFERGRRAFADAQCLACHRFGNDGGAIGPELTAAGSKYDRRSLLESILEPSKVVSEQYQHSLVVLKNGDSFSGRLIRDAADEIVLETDPTSGASERIARVRIDTVTPSTLSPMPEGLVNTLTREEILDLLAYLESGGRAAAAAFKSRPRD